MAGVIVLVAIFVLLLVWVLLGVRIVRPFERGVVERLGRYKQTVDPGLRLIVPLIDKVRIVDMREQVVDVPPQEVITKDNVVVSVDAVVYYEPTDPQRLVYNVANFMLAITKLAQTNLRNLIGDMQLDEALTSRDTINMHLREILDDATDAWGVRVKRVEIQRIDPPADVMNSMHEQMKAERQRRAAVTTADGDRQAAITRADGERQAAILRAQANRESQVLTAQGEAEATRALADAERYRQEAVARGQVRVRRDPRRRSDAGPDRHQVPRGAGQGGRRAGDEDLPPRRRRRQPDGPAGRRRRAVQGHERRERRPRCRAGPDGHGARSRPAPTTAHRHLTGT
jgi:regulator of protease activity HflC (stomatin/prohibitin superfamily)